MIERIVVLVDHTDDSLRALRPARVIADRVGAELIATTVVTWPSEWQDAAYELRQRIRETGVPVTRSSAIVNRTSVSEAVSGLVQRRGSAIVLATSGHNHDRALTGSIAEDLVHHFTDTPVIFVGPEVKIDSYEIDGPVLACVDPQVLVPEVIDAAARFARHLDTDHWSYSVVDQVVATESDVAAGDVAVGDVAVGSGSPTRLAHRLPVQLEGRRAALTLAKAAGTDRAALLVVGTRARSGLSRLLSGSVAIELVERAPCPVLAVHDANI